MNKEQLTEKLNEKFDETLGYKPSFEIVDWETGKDFPEYSTIVIKWKGKIEYWEIQVIEEYLDDNPWIEPWDGDYLSLLVSYKDKAQN